VATFYSGHGKSAEASKSMTQKLDQVIQQGGGLPLNNNRGSDEQA
jgi:hypothetical protein